MGDIKFVGDCADNKYYWKDGKQIVVHKSALMDIKTIQLEGDITYVDSTGATCEDRFSRENTENCEFDWGVPKIEYTHKECGIWSDLEPVGLSRDKCRMFKIATWKTKKILNEAQILKSLNSDRIVALREIIVWKGRFAGFSMDVLTEIHTFTNKQRKMLPEFLTTTVEYMHARSIFHCDIRLNNIMMDKQGQLKLIDFDIAQTKVDGKPTTYVPQARACLSISPRLDILDVMMATMLIYNIYEIDEINRKYLEDNNIQTDYFNNVQEEVHRILRPRLERELEGRLRM